jgi:hypothetical protein
MLADAVATLTANWTIVAPLGLVFVILLAVLIAWRRRRAWRASLAAYDREQRALDAFRRHLR